VEIIPGLMTSWPVTMSTSVILPPDPETPTSRLTFKNFVYANTNQYNNNKLEVKNYGFQRF
jgi:hypothetical protein